MLFPALFVFHCAVILSVFKIVVSNVVLFKFTKFVPSKFNPEFLM